MIRLLLIPLGFVVGVYGTLIGAGGGFVLVPILLLLYPQETSKTITSISLAVVFFNALSGSIAYGRQRRIDYRTGTIFALATVPGAIIGALVVRFFSRGIFDVVFGILLVAISSFIFIHPKPVVQNRGGKLGQSSRTLTDYSGISYNYSFDLRLGIVISLAVGFFSSLFGIGGGIIHVPALIQLLNFPAHIATATSHFILAIMAFTGTVVHIITGEYTIGWRRTLLLSIGVLVGAQFGAKLSQKVHGMLLLRLLALALGLVGLRLVLTVLV